MPLDSVYVLPLIVCRVVGDAPAAPSLNTNNGVAGRSSLTTTNEMNVISGKGKHRIGNDLAFYNCSTVSFKPIVTTEQSS